MSKLLFESETGAIIGAAMEVYYQLGIGFLEPVYQQALGIEFELRQIPNEPQKRLPITYKGTLLEKKYVADFVCFDQIIVEIKALSQLSPVDWTQTLNYLKITGFRVGLLFNFCSIGKLEYKRLII